MPFNMAIIGVDFVTKHTARRAVRIACPRAIGCTHPPLQRQMERLLMTLPGVLGAECFSAECALERVGRRSQGRLSSAPLLDAPSLAALALALVEDFE